MSSPMTVSPRARPTKEDSIRTPPMMQSAIAATAPGSDVPVSTARPMSASSANSVSGVSSETRRGGRGGAGGIGAMGGIGAVGGGGGVGQAPTGDAGAGGEVGGGAAAPGGTVGATAGGRALSSRRTNRNTPQPMMIQGTARHGVAMSPGPTRASEAITTRAHTASTVLRFQPRSVATDCRVSLGSSSQARTYSGMPIPMMPRPSAYRAGDPRLDAQLPGGAAGDTGQPAVAVGASELGERPRQPRPGGSAGRSLRRPVARSIGHRVGHGSMVGEHGSPDHRG